VRKSGEVFRGRPETAVGAHTTGYNGGSLGVCFEGHFELEDMPEAQKRAGAALVAELRERYPGICVFRHRELGTTACPGARFPFDEIVTEEKEEEEMSYEQFYEFMSRFEGERASAKPGDWSEGARDWAVSAGIVNGDGDGKFRWRSFVTREEICAMLFRAAKRG